MQIAVLLQVSYAVASMLFGKRPQLCSMVDSHHPRVLWAFSTSAVHGSWHQACLRRSVSSYGLSNSLILTGQGVLRWDVGRCLEPLYAGTIVADVVIYTVPNIAQRRSIYHSLHIVNHSVYVQDVRISFPDM